MRRRPDLHRSLFDGGRLRLGGGRVPAAAPAGAAMFQADVPLTYWSGRCSTGAGRTRPGSTVCLRVICTRAAGVS